MKSFCKECMWSKSTDELVFCVNLQGSSATACNRRFVFDDEEKTSCDGCETCECGGEKIKTTHSDWCPKNDNTGR